MAREETTKSNLIKLLQRISRGSMPHIGLIPTKEQHVPALALIVVPDKLDVQAISAAAESGADAFVVGVQAVSRWDELIKAAGDKPIGLQLGEADLGADAVKQYAERADFVIADVEKAPATLLDIETSGKVLAVDEEYAPHLIRTLGELPLDAVVAKNKANGASALSVRDLLHFRQVVDLVRRPVIALTDQRCNPKLLKLMRDMGIEAVLLPVAVAGGAGAIKETVAEYRKAIDGLGRPIGRARELGQALLPQMRAGARAQEPEPDDEPDDE